MASSRSLLPFWQSQAVRMGFGGPAFLWLLIITAAGTLVTLWNARKEIFTLPAALKDTRVEDLATFYRASEMTNAGAAASVYTPDLFRSGLSERLQDLIFLNPPHALALFHPFAWTDFATFKAATMALTLAALLALPRITGQPWVLCLLFAASTGAVQILLRLNLSLFVITLMVFALVKVRERPVLAGLALSLATIKPQYGLLVPFFLMGIGAWRCILWAATGTLALGAATLALFGPHVFEAYLASLSHPLYQAYALTALEWDTSLRSFLGRLGFPPGLRTAGVGLALVLGAVCAYRLPQTWPYPLRLGFLLLLCAACAPSFMYYSWPLFAAGILFMTRDLPDWPMGLQFLAGIAWMQPLLYVLLLPLPHTVITAHAMLVFILMISVPVCFFQLARSRLPGPG